VEARLVLIILAVTDLPRAVAFYQAAFGWSRSADTPVYVEFQMTNGQRLGLYQREAFTRNTNQPPHQVPPGTITATEVYFHTDDPPGLIARLAAAGARCLSALAPRDWGDEAAYFTDLEGNVLVIARPLARNVQPSSR
jgi:predicted enzyme related to lactoylglutathione lyase